MARLDNGGTDLEALVEVERLWHRLEDDVRVGAAEPEGGDARHHLLFVVAIFRLVRMAI